MYAEFPVFKYQTFDPSCISYSTIPASRSSMKGVRYYGAVTNLAPKPNELPKETSAEPAAAETPADSKSDSASKAEGQHE